MRANNGDSGAKRCLESNRIQEFDLQLESLSMSLSMQLSRLNRSSLQRIRSKSIGSAIQDIVNAGLNKLIDIYLSNELFYEGEINHLCSEIKSCMAPSTLQYYDIISSLNLVLDFEKVAYHIQDLPYDEMIRVLKCNLITSIQRRSQRRRFLPSF